MNRNLKDITDEQADALATLGAQLYFRKARTPLPYDQDAFSCSPSEVNALRVYAKQHPLTFMAEVE